MSGDRKLKIAFLWHMHQPYYFDSKNRKFAMPWVRFHALKDYLDMPLLAADYNIKATFNLVPSLVDQIELYSQGYLDRTAIRTLGADARGWNLRSGRKRPIPCP